MPDLKLVFKPKKNKEFTCADIKPGIAEKTIVVDFDERQQTTVIEKAVIAKIKESKFRTNALASTRKLTGLGSQATSYPGKYNLHVWVNEDRAARVFLYIEEPDESAEPKDVGLKSISNSKDMAKKIVELKQKEKPLKTMSIKKGDGEHSEDILWKIGSKSGSLPMTTHTKGTGGRNELAALNQIKKVLKEIGYV
jgi:hypothetical protein